jgi:hypothetical protein
MQLQAHFPHTPHDSAGTDCCGCIILRPSGNETPLICNECGAIVGLIHTDIL